MTIKLGIMLNDDLISPPVVKGKDRFEHFYLLGGTGSGKSTVFLNAIKQEMNDGAIFVLDPDGNFARNVASITPPERLVYINKDNPMIVNPADLDNVGKGERSLELISIINNSVSKYSATQFEISVRMGNILTEVIYALKDDDLNINKMYDFLEYQHIRKEFFRENRDKETQFWKVFDHNQKGFEKRKSAENLTDRFFLFDQRERISDFVNGKNQLDFKDIAEKKKVVIFDLKGLHELHQYLIGNLITHVLKNYYQIIATEQSPPIFVYIDEFHNFLTKNFNKMFTEIRKYNVSLNLTHQTCSQLDRTLFDIITGNFKTKMILNCGFDDASKLAPYFRVTKEEVLNLEQHQAYATIRNRQYHLQCYKPPKIDNPFIPPTTIRPPRETRDVNHFLSSTWLDI